MQRTLKAWTRVRETARRLTSHPDDRALKDIDIRMTTSEEARALASVTRRYFLVVGTYFSLLWLSRFFTETGQDLAILSVLSAAVVIACFGFSLIYLRDGDKLHRMEIASLTVNVLMLLNPLAYEVLHFDQSRMIYFLFLAVLYAISGISLRVLIPSLVLCVACMWSLAIAHRPEMAQDYMVLGLGGAATALGMSALVRRTLFQAVRARALAERLREEAQTLAECDALTGLPNRRSFFREMEMAIETLRLTGEGFDLALIDLDGFKPVNDIYGHSIGDALLVEVGRRLRRVCGDRAFPVHQFFPSRMGGDEFAVIMPGGRSQVEAETFGQQVTDALRETYLLGSVTATISASIGVVRGDDANLSISQFLERADYALYFAKQNMRGAAVVFTERHEAEMRDFSVVDQTLRSSDLDKELSIVFQPQIDIQDNRTTSFEALARWNSAKLGPVRPDIFIKAAERSGIITRITLLLLDKALAKVREWPQDKRVSFNLSARDLRSGNAISNIIKTVQKSGVDPRRIEFEITETAMLTDFEQACEALARLKAMGCRVAVDDFGAGWSSFSYIHRLPVDKIKIDRSFVVQLLKHDSAQKIIKTIIDLCANLNLDCVIEGVESPAELSKLRQIRARFIQGYIFSRPLNADQVGPYIVAEEVRLAAVRAAV